MCYHASNRAAPGKEKTMLTIQVALSFKESKPHRSGEFCPGGVPVRAYKAKSIGSVIS